MNGVSGWTLALEVPKAAADIFDRALAPISVATSAFEIEGSDLWRIEAFAVERPDENAVVGAVALAAELAGIDEPEVHVLPLPAIDWVAENQKSFEPIVAGRFFIHPTHYDGRIPWGVTRLAVDAGPAFGTGSHGSTMGCLAGDRSLITSPTARTSLDLGCGTGILAMAIARRWRRSVLAADIDPDAVATTRINAHASTVLSILYVPSAETDLRAAWSAKWPLRSDCRQHSRTPTHCHGAGHKALYNPGRDPDPIWIYGKSRKCRARRLSTPGLPSRPKGGF